MTPGHSAWCEGVRARFPLPRQLAVQSWLLGIWHDDQLLPFRMEAKLMVSPLCGASIN